MHGVWTALISPFTNNNELDLAAFTRLLKEQVSAGVTGVVPCGSTGESATLSLAEKRLLIQTAIKELKGTSVKVFAGTGTNNTAEAQDFSVWACEQGVDGIMLVTPYYNRPSQAGLENHFRTIADSVTCEVMLYNVPGRTAVSLCAETIGKLSTHPRITSLKDASGQIFSPNEVLDSVAKAGGSIHVLAGDDSAFLPFLSIGAIGVVSVASNLFPREMVLIQKAFEKNDLAEARRLHQKYSLLFRDLFIETNPVPIKYALAWAGKCQSFVRPPLAPLSPSSAEKLKASLKQCNIPSAGAAL